MKCLKLTDVAFPEHIGSQISGTPLDSQQSEWSFPSAKHPNMVWLQGAQIMRSGTEAFFADRGSQKVSTQLKGSKLLYILEYLQVPNEHKSIGVLRV